MAAVVFPDPNILAGSQYATTGETVTEYNNRLANAAKYSNQENLDTNKLYDKDFLTTLPYTITYIPNINDSVFISPHKVFIANLVESFGEEFLNNEAVSQTLTIESDEYAKALQVHELSTTELGGNDAINCYWSFNENDDIIYPSNAIDPNTCKLGLGRVYAETYQRTQVILWLTFGVPKYAGIWEFFNNAVDPNLAKVLHSGVASTAFTLGRIFGGALIFAFNLATLPLYVLNQIGKLFTSYTVTKYYELRITMPLWFRAVNNLAGTTAVNMGLIQGGDVQDADINTQLYGTNNMPGMLRRGLDIYAIMSKRATYMAARNGQNPPVTSDDLLKIYEQAQGDPKTLKETNPEVAATGGWFTEALDAMVANGTGSASFVGFRVEKSVDASESIGNSTAQSQLQQTLNQKVKEMDAARFMAMDGDTGTKLGNFVTEVGKTATDIFRGMASSMNVSGLAGLALGSGYFDIPEVYQDSSFSTSYSFSMDLVSHYTDRVSIFQNCYMPTFMILAAALPRQTGKNSYIQPFLTRGYCQGRFAIPLGMFDSVNIKRGGDEYGWTEEGFPTRVHISFSIKDLSPLMFLGMGGGTSSMGDTILGGAMQDILNIFDSNTAMQEYLSTLGGLGLRERVLAIPTLKRKFKAWLNIHWQSRLANPYFWGSSVGNIPAIQSVMALNWSRLSNR